MIRAHLAPLARHKGALGLRDDAALLRIPPGHELVVTKDAIVESVHFIGDEPPAQIAQKLLRVNLSDLAAMGATPYGYFLALMLPQSIDEAWMAQFAQGLREDGEAFALSLLGGDTTRIPGPLAMSATLLGLVPVGQALTRAGAQENDLIYVTGTLGDAALGLEVALGNEPFDAHLLARYRLPQPRLAVAESLRLIGTSCIDISDGLMQDLGHLCEASGLGATVRWAQLPLSAPARALQERDDFRDTVLAGGDDYELLFTAPAEVAQALDAIAREANVPITCIGQMIQGDEAQARDERNNPITLARAGYTHF